MAQSIFHFSEPFRPHPRVLQRDGWTDRPSESESCTGTISSYLFFSLSATNCLKISGST